MGHLIATIDVYIDIITHFKCRLPGWAVVWVTERVDVHDELVRKKTLEG